MKSCIGKNRNSTVFICTISKWNGEEDDKIGKDPVSTVCVMPITPYGQIAMKLVVIDVSDVIQ